MTASRTRVRRRAVARRPIRASTRIRPAIAQDGSTGFEDPLAEAENELGQNEWIDPETGELAEGESPPRLGEE